MPWHFQMEVTGQLGVRGAAKTLQVRYAYWVLSQLPLCSPSEDWQVLRLGRANDNLRQAACWCTHCDDSAKARPTFC